MDVSRSYPLALFGRNIAKRDFILVGDVGVILAFVSMLWLTERARYTK